MNIIFRNVTKQILSFIFLLILAALPLGIIRMGAKVDFSVPIILSNIKYFIIGVFSGTSFYYTEGDRTHFILSDLMHYFLSSYLYVIVAGVILIILSYILGIWFWRRTEKWLTSILGLIGMIPDFIVVLLLQLLVVSIYIHTGIKVAKVASISISEPALLLPILTIVIIPLFYIVRTLNERTHEVLTEDYILTAKAKGLSKKYIYLFHVTANVIPFFKADLHKITGIMISNLFIVEYLYNLRGITTLLFQHQIKFGYQYNLVVICFLALFFLYLAVYYTLKLLITITERVLSYD
jgi:peptide/nickel transport system permease protein